MIIHQIFRMAHHSTFLIRMISHAHKHSVTDQDKETSPPDSLTLTVTAAEINPHTQAELYTAYQAPSVSGSTQTDMR